MKNGAKPPAPLSNLKAGADATEADLITYCRDNMAAFKTPKTVIFEELPKTSTGKVQKFELRQRAKAL